MLYVTAVFSGVLTLMFIKRAFHVIELRKVNKLSLGDGGVDELMRSIRAHGNFSEYVPIGLIMMATLELNGAAWSWVAFLGGFLILGCHFHAKGMLGGDAAFEKRVIGMKFTLLGLALLALANIVWVSYLMIASIRFAANIHVN